MRFSCHVVLVLICCSLGYKCVGSPEYEFFCQLDLAFLFTATSFLILLGMVFVGLWGFLHGVATLNKHLRHYSLSNAYLKLHGHSRKKDKEHLKTWYSGYALRHQLLLTACKFYDFHFILSYPSSGELRYVWA